MTTSLFLVAVSFPNFDRTVTDPVTLSEFDPPPEVTRELPDDRPVRVWGTRKGGGNREQYAELAADDRLLFYHEDAYLATGRVGKTFTTPWISRTFWGYAPRELLYTVEDYRETDLAPETVNAALGFDAAFRPEGLHRVDDERVRGADAVDDVLDGLLGDRLDGRTGG